MKENNKTPKSALKYYEKIVPLAYTQGLFGILGKVKRILISLIGLFNPIPREPT